MLYAGREVDLAAFLDSLEQRTCHRRSQTILTAGLELGEILRDREESLRSANLTVLAASTVDIDVGVAEPDAETAPEYVHAVFTEHFDAGHLADGGAVMTHDALLTAARAVRLAAPQGAASTPGPADGGAHQVGPLYLVRD